MNFEEQMILQCPYHKISPPQMRPFLLSFLSPYVKYRSNIDKATQKEAKDLTPKSKILMEKDFYACDSEFNKLEVLSNKERKGRQVCVIDRVIVFESAKDDLVMIQKGKSKKYTPISIRSYRLFYVFPQPTLFMCMKNGNYSVVPGFHNRSQKEALTCEHNLDSRCMGCLSFVCIECLSDCHICPHCMYESYDRNTIVQKTLRSVVH